jgi:hypothetical protein
MHYSFWTEFFQILFAKHAENSCKCLSSGRQKKKIKAQQCYIKGSKILYVRIQTNSQLFIQYPTLITMKIALIAFTLAGLVSCGSTWKQSGKVFWDHNCDFLGDDIHQVASRGEECGGICENTVGCHKFTFYNGVCYLKNNILSDYQVKSGAVCGYLDARPEWHHEGSVTWARDCDFWGGDIEALTNIPSNQCGQKCTENERCKSFSWNRLNGGTCYLKEFEKLQYTKIDLLTVGGGGVCGYLRQFNSDLQVLFLPTRQTLQ